MDTASIKIVKNVIKDLYEILDYDKELSHSDTDSLIDAIYILKRLTK